MKHRFVSLGAVAVLLALCLGPTAVMAKGPQSDVDRYDANVQADREWLEPGEPRGRHRMGMEAALMEAAATVCNPPAGCPVSGFQRTEVLKGIVHYSAILQTGPGAHEKIGIHRVVREKKPGHPDKQDYHVFLQHGDLKDFIGMFLPALYSPAIAQDYGLAIYLAKRKVDVWGIQQSWTLVPQDATDYSFMENWGMQYQVDVLRSALAVAREVRKLQGGSGGQLNLLGYSSGGMTGYALLNHETQLPKRERHVKAYVSADMNYDTFDADWNAFICNDIHPIIDALNAGEYGYFMGFRTLGILAKTDPGGPSPIFPGFTNLDVAIFLGVAPFGDTPIHYLAGVFDETGFPVGLQYLSTEQWLDFMTSGFDWEPTQFLYDYYAVLCDQYDSPFDDHLADIKVPVFNWGAAGGLGPYGTATLDLLGSKDTADYIVSTHPPEDIFLDFAHIDLFAADNAPKLAWQPLFKWLKKHK